MQQDINSTKDTSDLSTPLIPNQVFIRDGDSLSLSEEEGFGHLQSEIEQKIESEVEQTESEMPVIYMFINPKSGSREGEKLLKLHVEKMRIVLESGERVDICFYNIMDEISRTRGMKSLKVQSRVARIRVVSAGGDGTPAWIIQEMIRTGISLGSVYLIVLPFGTVNVLSRNLGWYNCISSAEITDSIYNLRNSVRLLLEGEVMQYDVWTIEIIVEGDGFIEIQRKFKKGTSKVHLRDKLGVDLKKVKRCMVSFFSIGLDGRIGFEFDKHRTGIRSCNIFCYLASGLENVCCSRNPPISSFTSHFSTYESGHEHIIYDSKRDYISQNTVVFMAINQRTFGPSYHIWDKASDWEALSTHYWEPQSTSDQLLEWLAVPSLGLQLEIVKAIGINVLRMHQGKGPFHVKFNREDKNSMIYMEIDGEYLCVYRPKEVIVTLSKECEELKMVKHNI